MRAALLAVAASALLAGCKIDLFEDDAFDPGLGGECVPGVCSETASLTFAVPLPEATVRAAALRATVCHGEECANGIGLEWSCKLEAFCSPSCTASASLLGRSMTVRPVLAPSRCGERELELGLCITLSVSTAGLREGSTRVDVVLEDAASGSRLIDERVELDLAMRATNQCGEEVECLAGSTSVVVEPPVLSSAEPSGGAVPTVAAGTEHTCATTPEGALACWGAAAGTPPAGTFRSVSVGDRYACGINAAGAIDCWGSDTVRDEALSPPLGTFASVAVGSRFGCGVRDTGRVECWGMSPCQYANYLLEAPDALSARGGTACGIVRGMGARCWGDRRDRVESAVAVAVGGEHLCTLDVEGVVTCIGDDEYGQLDTPSGRYVSLVAGEAHACALDADGRATCWGAGATPRSGECEDPPECGQSAPPDEAFVQISAGDYHMCGVTRDARVVCWGDDAYGKATSPAP